MNRSGFDAASTWACYTQRRSDSAPTPTFGPIAWQAAYTDGEQRRTRILNGKFEISRTSNPERFRSTSTAVGC
jgi:hypothetical protein